MVLDTNNIMRLISYHVIPDAKCADGVSFNDRSKSKPPKKDDPESAFEIRDYGIKKRRKC